MGRKSSNRNPASSAAAAANTTTPTFTSFAAATAHALGAYPGSNLSSVSAPVPTSHEASQWDTDALQLLKKLSKRDATTKLRAIADLTAHVESLTELQPGVGSNFVHAWGPAFRASVLDDSSPPVRTALLNLMAIVVAKFRRLIQPIFPSILPSWLAARGDVTPSVAQVAAATIAGVLPTETHRKKVVDRYGDDLRAYCTDVLQSMAAVTEPDRFVANARHVAAVLAWLVTTAASPAAVASVIDSSSNPLMFLSRGPKQKKKDANELQPISALREACELAIAVLQQMSLDDESDQRRASNFAELALHGVRKSEPMAWELILVMLRDGWHEAFPDGFKKLGDAIGDAVTAKFPTGLSALIQLLDALPGRTETSAALAQSILSRMKKAIHPRDEFGLEAKQQARVAYLLSALPTYIDCATFAQSEGSVRWFDGNSPDKLHEYSSAVVAEHILPTLQFFICGELPPVPKLQSKVNNGSTPRRAQGNGNKSIADDLSRAIAISLRGLEKERLFRALQTVAKSFIGSLNGRNSEEALRRYLSLLDNMTEDGLASILATAVVEKLVALPSNQSEAQHSRALSMTLAKGASSQLYKNCAGDEGRAQEQLIADLLEYTRIVLTSIRSQTQTNANQVESVSRDLGEVCSWIHWATKLEKETVLVKLMDYMKDSLGGNAWMPFMTEVLRAHKRRQEASLFQPCHAMSGASLERAVIEAADDLRNGTNKNAISFVTAASDPRAGANIPLPILKQVAEIVAERILADNDFDSDELLIALLRSPAQYLDTGDAFHRLLGVALLRAGDNGAVYSETLSLLRSFPSRKAADHVSRILTVIANKNKTLLTSGDEAITIQARVTARLMRDISQLVGRESVGLCQEILSWPPVPYTTEVVRVVPLSSVFGDGDSMEFRHELFLNAWKRVWESTQDRDTEDLMLAFVNSLNQSVRGIMARRTSEALLNGSNGSFCKLLCSMCSSHSADIADWGPSAEGVSASISEHLPRSDQVAPGNFARIPRVVRLCVRESQGRYLDNFKDIIAECLKIIRRDPLSDNSLISLDVLSGSLAIPGHIPENNDHATGLKKPSWLVDDAKLALLAVRRCLERSTLSSHQEIQRLETHGATFFADMIRGVDVANVGQDDLRFWVLRTKDILQSCVEDDAAQEGDTVVDGKKFASASVLGSVLGSVLVDTNDVVQVGRPDMIDEICHYGAWTGVTVLPVYENIDKGEDDAVRSLMEAGARHCSSLILKAAEKGVLLSANGSIPIDMERVYSLAPLLSSHASFTRKAVLTILTYAATVHLSGKVSTAFPENGFADETKEIEFVTNFIPRSLRLALEWPGSSDMAESRDSNEHAARELGFFLAWRLFLDLIRSDDTNGGSTFFDDIQEDVSFRRVGITYLRSKPDLYAQFFNKCVEVVVDGNVPERLAAGMAAAEALQVEERAAQGVQLVQQQEAREEKAEVEEGEQRQVTTGSEMESEVGKAAGIAFARALQRLPALSRQHVTDRLDRSTALRVESFVRKRVSPLLIAAEIRKVKEWGAFGGGRSSSSGAGPSSTSGEAGMDIEGEGELHARGSVAGREVWATYTFSDVTLEIGMRLPDVFPLNTVEVEARSRIGMSEARWRKTLLGMTTLLRAKDGTLAEAVELWRRNLDKTFQGAEECPICYSVLHLTTAALPRMQCRTCKNLFHSECLCKWFTKSNSSACPLCRSAF